MSSARIATVLLMLCSFADTVHTLVQDDINDMASNIQVRYDVVDNLIDSWLKYKARVTLQNKGSRSLKQGPWALYFCSIRIVEPDHLPNNPHGYIIPGGPGIKLTHINGCLHKMEPTTDFKDLAPDSSVKIEFKVKYFAVAKTDIMPNWYFGAEGLVSKAVKNTQGEGLDFVGEFTTEHQWRRYTGDNYHPLSPGERFDRIEASDLGKAPLLLIPTPLKISGWEQGNRMKVSNAKWKIIADKGLENEASFLEEIRATIVNSSPPLTKVIKMELKDPDVTIGGSKTTNQEAYSLVVDVSGQTITIHGNTTAAVFYGIQSLLAIIDDKGTVPKVTVKDAPRYAYRGMHLDVGRNFKTKDKVLQFLDMLATYKFNKFHFHLCEDEGWRLQIKGLEELTEIGSKRCHDLNETTCIIPQLGSPPEGLGSRQYYTSDEYQEILTYAKKRHIQVIPEFDMPGHSHAAIKSMEARYHKLKSRDIDEAKKYLLTELDDPSKYITVQWFTDDATNPCIESTYNFVTHVVDALIDMHKSIQPLTLYHFGGDEVAEGAWKNSSACKALAGRLGLDFSAHDIVDNLKDYFVQRVANITSSRGLDLGGWEDGLLGPNYVPYRRERIQNRNVYAYAWRGGGRRTNNLANADYKVILSQATYLYFDHPYEPDPQERGYYWAARFTDTRKTFSFLPENLYANVRVDRWGNPLTRKELCKEPNSCPELQKKSNIVGMAGALWTETVRTDDQMDSMIFPRLLALSERAWHKASWEDIANEAQREKEMVKDWEEFSNFLGHQELSRLDRLGVKYRVPVPGAKMDGKRIATKTLIPGLVVQYSRNDGKTWHNVSKNTELHGNVILATRSADGSRLSRSVKFKGPVVSKGRILPSVHGIVGLLSWLLFFAFY